MMNYIINTINTYDPTGRITLKCAHAPSTKQMLAMGKYTLDYIIAIVAILIRKGEGKVK